MAEKLRNANPEAFKNILGRLIEANNRGMWEADSDMLDKLQVSKWADLTLNDFEPCGTENVWDQGRNKALAVFYVPTTPETLHPRF